MLKELIQKYGKEKIDTLTKFPSILTLHRMGDKGRLTLDITTPLDGEVMEATEKIDGTNTRIICYGDEYLVGARDFILHHSDDLYYATDQGIVDGLKALGIKPPKFDKFTVIYGEFYGGKVTANSKWYGTDAVGFRVFAVAVYDDLSILERTRAEISRWRERETESGIIYGQKFVTREEAIELLPNFEFTPVVPFDLGDMSMVTILKNMKEAISQTRVALSEKASKRAEGLVLSNANRTKVVKLRFEDYERTLK